METATARQASSLAVYHSHASLANVRSVSFKLGKMQFYLKVENSVQVVTM
jgi:hypothetical protein